MLPFSFCTTVLCPVYASLPVRKHTSYRKLLLQTARQFFFKSQVSRNRKTELATFTSALFGKVYISIWPCELNWEPSDLPWPLGKWQMAKVAKNPLSRKFWLKLRCIVYVWITGLDLCIVAWCRKGGAILRTRTWSQKRSQQDDISPGRSIVNITHF